MSPHRLLLLVLPAVLGCEDRSAPTAPVPSEPAAARGGAVTPQEMRLLTPSAAHGAGGIVGQPTDLGSRVTQPFSFAYGINESGQVAGFAGPELGENTPDAVRWEADGTPVVLPKASPGGQAWALDVSDAGVVVGVDNEVEPGGGFVMHAMRWNPDGSSTELPLAPGAIGQSPEAIAGEVVVGWAELTTLGTRAVRWDGQGAHLLPSVGPFTAALDVNEAGTAVGYTGPGEIPALWTPAGELRLLEMPRGDNFGFATGINNLGEAVGTTGVNTGGPEIGPHHAVTWSSDGRVHVLPRSENTSEDFSDGTAINDAGVVAGSVEDRATGVKTAVIWLKHRRVDVPPGASARPFINDVSESQLAGGFSPASTPHTARWTLAPPRGFSR